MKYRILFILIAFMASAQAFAAPIDKFVKRTELLQEHVAKVSGQFHQQRMQITSPDIQARLSEGLVLQAAGDYDRASYIFMDIVAHESWANLPAYNTAKLYLARSLNERGYYRLCEKHLVEFLHQPVAIGERDEAIRLLVRNAQRTENWDVVIEAIQQNGSVSEDPVLQYALGRSLFLQGRDEEALAVFNGIRDLAEWGIKSWYIKGAVLTRLGRMEEAIDVFRRTAVADVNFPDAEEVRMLANLALARIFYEQQEWALAVENYQKIPETSDFFGEVLFEMGWTRIRQEKYKEAKQVFELLLMSYPKHRRAPETRQVMADIERSLGQYDSAMVSYQNIVSEYEPILDRMKSEETDSDRRREIIENQVANGEFNSVEIIPDAARETFANADDVNRVETVIGSLQQSDSNTLDSEQIISEIENIINSQENIRSLPHFRMITHNVRDIYIEAVLLAYDLTEEFSVVPPGAKAEIEKIQSMPRSQHERDILSSLQIQALDEKAARYHRIQLSAENTRHRLKIVQNWVRNDKTGSITEEERLRVEQELADIENRINQVKAAGAEIEGKLSLFRIVSVNGANSDEDPCVLLDNMSHLLQTQWESDIANVERFSGYRKLIPTLTAIFEDIRGLDGEIDLAVAEKMESLSERLEREKKIVAQEKARYGNTRQEVSQTAGDLAARFWESVYSRIENLVIDADLGMVDIAWLMKDSRSKELQTVLEERKKDRAVLEQDFQQIMKENEKEKQGDSGKVKQTENEAKPSETNKQTGEAQQASE